MLPFKLIYHEGYDLNLGGHACFRRRNTGWGGNVCWLGNLQN